MSDTKLCGCGRPVRYVGSDTSVLRELFGANFLTNGYVWTEIEMSNEKNGQ